MKLTDSGPTLKGDKKAGTKLWMSQMRFSYQLHEQATRVAEILSALINQIPSKLRLEAASCFVYLNMA